MSSTGTVANLQSGVSLGWISQGQWSVTIEAKNSSGVVVYSATDNFTFTTNNKDKAMKLVEKVEAEKVEVTIGTITVPPLTAASGDTSTGDPNFVTETYSVKVLIDSTSVTLTAGSANANNEIPYAPASGSDKLTISSGSHTYTVQLVRNVDSTETVVGGVHGVFFAAASASGKTAVSISGELNPADFTSSTIDVDVDSVFGTISASSESGVTDDAALQTTQLAAKMGKQITFTFAADTTNGSDSIVASTTKWYVNSEEVSTGVTTDATTSKLVYTFSAPGYKYVSLTVNGKQCGKVIRVNVGE